MAYTSLSALFTDIANAIRAKRGTSSTISPQNFPSQISAITTNNFGNTSKTLDSLSSTITFENLSGQPKFFVAIMNQSSQSSSFYSSYGSILAVYKTAMTGTTLYALYGKTKSSSGIAGRSNNISYSYDSSTATLTITSGSIETPGRFQVATYSLYYIY